MTLQLSLLIVHLFAMAGFLFLYRKAPCWMQKLVMIGLVFGALFISIGYGISLAQWMFPQWGLYGERDFWLLGLVTEHVSVLLYVFRLLYQKYEKDTEKLWKQSSAEFLR